MTTVDRDSVASAYEEVRSDLATDVNWMIMKYEGDRIVCTAKGDTFAEFAQEFQDDQRAFGYLRINTGDEMSKRTKFALIIWLGPDVSVLKKARMSTDRAEVKRIVEAFSIEMLMDSQGQLDYDSIRSMVDKTGGSAYGTGK